MRIRRVRCVGFRLRRPYDRPQQAAVESEGSRMSKQDGITRRDFVGNALLGSGAALLGMASPLALRPAAAQTTGLPMTGLGPDWAGPGGVGDYSNANANTWEMVNAAHGGVRNQEEDKFLASASDTGESF